MNINAQYALIDKINTFKGSIQPIEEFIDNAYQFCNSEVQVVINEDKKSILIKDDGNGLTQYGWKSIRTLFAPPEKRNGFSYAGTGTKSWPAIAKSASLKSYSKECIYDYTARWNSHHLKLEILEEAESFIETTKTGTTWTLKEINIDSMCRGSWRDLYVMVKEKIQEKYEYKVFLDNIKGLKKKINISYKCESKKEEHVVYGKDYEPNKNEPYELKEKLIHLMFSEKLYDFEVKYFRQDNHSNSKSSHGVKVFFENVLMGTTKGFFTTARARNNSTRSAKGVQLTVHDNMNPINIAIFLNHNNKAAVPIDSSKSEIRTNGWPDKLKVKLAEIHYVLKEQGKAIEKIKNVKKNKGSDVYKTAAKKMGFDIQRKDEDFFKLGTANASKPFHLRGVDGKLLINPESEFARKMIHLDIKELPEVRKFLTPFIEHLMNYSHDFVRKNNTRMFSADLFRKFIEESAEDFNIGKQS